MNPVSHYNRLFYGLLLLVIVFFLYCKFPGGKTQLFIHGDGLGYYSYLPATFIYDDGHYEFKWFNEVYTKYYGPGLFENPEDNFMVDYGERRINKYYQGLAFLWMPFFVVAHWFALVTGQAADGFSAPYQTAIGLASLFYILLGLFYVRKLLLLLYNDQFTALIIPGAVLFGSFLFSFAFDVNSHTHSYSYTFISAFLYYLCAFSRSDSNKVYYLLCCLLTFLITVFVRPLNGLILLTVPAFISIQDLKFRKHAKISALVLVVLLVLICMCFFQLSIMYRQTGTLLVYTYTDERFYFERSRFFDALISYHMGLFVYVPLFFISLFGLMYLPKKQRLILPATFFMLVFIYSSWWFWPIVKRGMIDFYAIPAIFLGALVSADKSRLYRAGMGLLIFLCVCWYQFRHFQIRVGALDEWQTTKEMFWTNFWRTTPAQMYPVPMSSVLKSSFCENDFENEKAINGLSDLYSVSGHTSVAIDQIHYIAKVAECAYPDFFKRDEGIKKIRLSFDARFEGEIEALHLFLRIGGKDGAVMKEIAFYINKEQLWFNKWDRREYGCEIDPGWFTNNSEPEMVDVVAWNVKSSGKAYLDNVKIEFFLTDHSFETQK